MAIAGRVAIVPKGEYSNAVTYDKLDLVMFNNDAYVAKKASTGIEPTNDEYWMLILNNVVAEDLEKIIDGTTAVGNANKLGGKDASEYALQSNVDFIQTTSLSNPTTFGWYRVAEVTTGGDGSTNDCDIALRTGFANTFPEYARLRVRTVHNIHEIMALDRRNNTGSPLLLKARLTTDTKKTYFEVYYSSGSTNPLRVEVSHGMSPYVNASWRAINATPTEETVSGVTILTTYDIPANAKPVIVNGDRVFSNNGTKVMGIHNTNSSYTLFTFYGQDAELGSLGFDGVNNPMYRGADGKTGSLLHTGNKPSGTYTGNGIEREVWTNGIGSVAVVRGNGYNMLVTASGSFGCNDNGSFVADSAYITDGVIKIPSNSVLNATNYTYHYQDL